MDAVAGPGIWQELFRLGSEGLGGVDHPEGHGGAFYALLGAFYADAFHGVVGVAKAGGVEESEQSAADLARVLYHVACGSGDVADNRFVIVQQTVEQGGLPGVGSPGDGHWHTLLEHFAGGVGMRQTTHHAQRFRGGGDQRGAVGKLHILLGKVKLQLQQRTEMNQLPAQFLEFVGERPRHLLHGQTVRSFRTGRYQVRHGLRLRQIHTSVHERPLRELSRTCGTCAEPDKTVYRLALYPS